MTPHNDGVSDSRSEVRQPARAQSSGHAPSTFGGTLAALALAESFRPSLLPRTLVTQIIVSALAVVTGYAVGAAFGAIARAIFVRLGVSPAGLRVLAIVGRSVAVLALIGAVALAPGRLSVQTLQRSALGLEATSLNPPLVLLGSIAGALLLIALGRALRAGARRLGRLFTARWGWSPRAAVLAGGALEAVACVGFIVVGLAVLGPLFAARDRRITADERPPISALRSGGSGSLVSWETLGVQGRRFVGGGASLDEISTLRGAASAPEPIRAYVGLNSAPTLTARAELAIRELERTGAFDRAAIVVATPAGTGYVNPVAIDPLELILGGDVATVALQYSVLPSFLSVALDGPASVDAGRTLLNAVLARTSRLPRGDRPDVYVYGESLGAFGSQAAFEGRGIHGLERVSGALWVGPTAASGFRRELLAGATTGPARAPIVGGGAVVRFANDAAGLRELKSRWGPVRAAYLQHATDPVVWFAPSLAWSRPEWLDEPPGPGVPPEMAWRPLLTFEQVLMDLPLASSAASGYGHDYDADVPLAWVEIVRPDDWSERDTREMLQLLGTEFAVVPVRMMDLMHLARAGTR